LFSGMSLKVKAKEREMKVGLYAGTYRYVMVPEIYSSLAQEKVIREAALRSGVSQGVMQACWDAAGSVIKAWATEGHSVALPGLGTMRFGLSAKSVADVNDVKTSLIRTRRIVFTPSTDLKDELRNTSVIITCYDRDGKEVKRVTSADDGIVENNEDTGDDNGVDNGSTTGGNTSGGNTNGNSGSGSVSQGVTAPTFSGNTQFTESTQVSMSGPAGAEIRYTTDGSQPTAQSTLYSGPLTLTETTTVKAIAIKDGQSSAVTSRTYTKGSNSGGGGGENGDMD
jgi:predicted histone-like DNA-binding protein